MQRLSPAEISSVLTSSNLTMTNSLRRQLTDLSSPLDFDNAASYDKWAQTYRMLGPYIDCDHQKKSNQKKNENKNKNDENKNNNNENKNKGRNLSGDNNNNVYCSRWVMWASYVNPNYQGNEYKEYFGNNPTSPLDCHEENSNYKLVGVYRQELYQFYEQISKHLWAIDEYEYVVAIAGLKYMTNYDCRQIGYDNYGAAIYGGVEPLPNADIMMGVYSDDQCTTLLTNSKYTYASFGLESDYGGSSYSGKESTWWANTQEPTLTLFNEVFEIYKSCVSCVDYPTYQDGYFKGNDGTEDGYLINQCWKFYSHNSYQCNGDCIAMANAQGTVMQFAYEGNTYGYGTPKESYNSGYTDGYNQVTTSRTSAASSVSRFSKLKANAFIGISTILFVGTFLAFAIARASARALDRKSKSQHLLFDEEKHESRSRKSSSGRSARSNNKESRRSSEQKLSKEPTSTGRSSQRSKSKSGSSRKTEKYRDSEVEPEPRRRSRSASQSRRQSSSRVVQEDPEPRSSRRRERERDDDYRRYYNDDY